MPANRRVTCFVAGLLTATFLTLAAPSDAAAFCGFYVSGAEAELYNNATMISLMRHGKRTVLSMQNNYQGPPKDFAMVVPVPVVLKKKQVQTLTNEVFERLDRLTAPRLVEYWEHDPCRKPRTTSKFYNFDDVDLQGGLVKPDGATISGKVTVHEQFEVGEYDIVILSSTESTALEDWLDANDYNIPSGAAPYFKPYIQNGHYFFVAKVDVKKVKFEGGSAVLSPLRFHYDTDDFVLPVRLGLINSKGVQDLIAFVLAQNKRYEAANYPNVTIPTNVVVGARAKTNFGGFYNELFKNVLKESPKAVVTEYSWATSNCDPCPGPPLRRQDLRSLGNDVISQPNHKWVVTRLHARYNKHTLGKDLVFKAATPIKGGRGMPQGAEGTFASKTAQPSVTNTFQGRYIMLHPWEGDVDCEDPRRGRWGGPPEGKASTKPAAGMAFDTPQSAVGLASYVEDEQVAGLSQATAKYDEPAGEVLESDGESVQKSPSQGTRPRESSSGGCASPSGSKTAGASLLVILLAFVGLGRRITR